jgi:NAD(P)-dependent dehydrogenase (short-subunit alcohol dehydrogenase family)
MRAHEHRPGEGSRAHGDPAASRGPGDALVYAWTARRAGAAAAAEGAMRLHGKVALVTGAPQGIGRAAARRMVKAGGGGALVNVSSMAIRGTPLGVHDAASKAGVVGLTCAVALALAPPRIRVHAIAPGPTVTAQPRPGHSEAERAELGPQIPLEGRLARPEEIARVVVFLASDEAGWITGQTIHVNGGAFMGG